MSKDDKAPALDALVRYGEIQVGLAAQNALANLAFLRFRVECSAWDMVGDSVERLAGAVQDAAKALADRVAADRIPEATMRQLRSNLAIATQAVNRLTLLAMASVHDRRDYRLEIDTIDRALGAVSCLTTAWREHKV